MCHRQKAWEERLPVCLGDTAAVLEKWESENSALERNGKKYEKEKMGAYHLDCRDDRGIPDHDDSDHYDVFYII